MLFLNRFINTVANPFVNSLKVRLMASILAMVIIILPSIAFIIVNSFENHMIHSIENELSAYSYSILAVAEVEQTDLIMPSVLIENQFNINESGLYAFISGETRSEQSTTQNPLNKNKTLWRSESLLTLNLPQPLPNNLAYLVTGKSAFNTIKLNQSPHFIYSYAVSFNDHDINIPLTVHIVKDQQAYLQLITDFKQQLWLGLAVMMLVILLLQLIWLIWTLKPLSTLQQEVKAIEQGQAQRLTGHYPKELSPLTSQLNQLLDTEQKQRSRYRNALSDLAHSLKTPLAVLQAQSNISAVNQEQITRINSTIEHQLKRAQSAGHSSWLLGISLKPIVEKLVNTLAKIYRDNPKEVMLSIPQQLVFKGDEADLLELLGNLLDNAYKAANSTISLTASQQDNALVLIIADDGIGIQRDEIRHILKRGVRADTYHDGHGVGLAIVRDLVDSYQGTLHIDNSATLGGAQFTLSFGNM